MDREPGPSLRGEPRRAVERRIDGELVKAKLVAEARFTEWTSAGEMRHPAFLGIREDKKPTEVVLEKEAHSPK
jgi:ATP-dependent DNA ligase